jgi:hypothetical protein
VPPKEFVVSLYFFFLLSFPVFETFFLLPLESLLGGLVYFLTICKGEERKSVMHPSRRHLLLSFVGIPRTEWKGNRKSGKPQAKEKAEIVHGKMRKQTPRVDGLLFFLIFSVPAFSWSVEREMD